MALFVIKKNLVNIVERGYIQHAKFERYNKKKQM